MAERKSWVDQGIEWSKKLDIAGGIVGLGMMAFGMIGAGAILFGTSVATYIMANEIQKRRK